MDLGLTGKVALVTGGSRKAEGVDVWGRVADVSDRQQVRRLVSEVVERFGRLGGALYLAPDVAGYLTGLTVPFDGGATRRVV